MTARRGRTLPNTSGDASIRSPGDAFAITAPIASPTVPPGGYPAETGRTSIGRNRDAWRRRRRDRRRGRRAPVGAAESCARVPRRTRTRVVADRPWSYDAPNRGTVGDPGFCHAAASRRSRRSFPYRYDTDTTAVQGYWSVSISIPCGIGAASMSHPRGTMGGCRCATGCSDRRDRPRSGSGPDDGQSRLPARRRSRSRRQSVAIESLDLLRARLEGSRSVTRCRPAGGRRCSSSTRRRRSRPATDRAPTAAGPTSSRSPRRGGWREGCSTDRGRRDRRDLHAERVDRATRSQITHVASAAELPDGSDDPAPAAAIGLLIWRGDCCRGRPTATTRRST